MNQGLQNQRGLQAMESTEAKIDNRVRHGHQHANYDRKAIYQILDSGYMCHIAFVIDNIPHVNPTIYWRADSYVYWHGSATSRMLQHLAKGLDVCFNVAHLDGLLLGRSAFLHSANYRSVTIYGQPELIRDYDEKVAAVDQMIEHLYPGRSRELVNHRENEIKAVKIFKLKVDVAAAKERYDLSVMQALSDAKQYSYGGFGEGLEGSNCWTGLIPIRQSTLAPIADAYVAKSTPEPEYLINNRFKIDF